MSKLISTTKEMKRAPKLVQIMQELASASLSSILPIMELATYHLSGRSERFFGNLVPAMPTPEAIRKKLEYLQPSQESVETVSLWCLHHKDDAASIVSAWLQIFKNAGTDKQRLSLFYLANDVCQKGRKKKGQEYLTNFVPALKEAILLSRHESIRQNIGRIINIWEERNVFDASTIKEFRSILEASKSADGTPAATVAESRSSSHSNNNNESIMSDFSLASLISDTEKYQKSTEAVERCRVLLPSTSLASDGNMKALLKSRQEGQRFIDDINQSHKKLSEFVDECERRLKRHHQLIIALERARIFFDTQLQEAGIVQTAYEKFGVGVKAVRERLTKMQKSGNYNYIPGSDFSSNPDEFSFADGIGVAPKHRDDTLETVDMDLDDDVKFAGIPNPSRPVLTQETAIEGMKLATNQSFLNDPPAVVASNGANFSVDVPPKKMKLDPRQQKHHQSTPPTNESIPTPTSAVPPNYAMNPAAASSAVAPNPNWPTDHSQHYAPPVATYPSGFGMNAQQPASVLQSPPPFLSQPPPQGHYPMQQHSNYGAMTLPPPPPPQPMSASPYGAGTHAFAGTPTNSSDMGGVFDYDHGTAGQTSPSAMASGHGGQPGGFNTRKRSHHYDVPQYPEAGASENRMHRYHPPDPQYFDHPVQSYGGGGGGGGRPSHSHHHEHHQYAPTHRGHNYGRGGGRV